MKKNIILVAIVILFFVGLAFWGRAAQKTTPVSSSAEQVGKGLLSAEEKLYDFGSISMKDGNVSKIFKVINSTDKDVFIPSLTTSCMCTSAYFVLPDGSKKGPFGMVGMGYVPKLNETVKAGESRDIEVVYDPNAHGPAGVGSIDRFITLTDDSGNEINFEIKAVVTP